MYNSILQVYFTVYFAITEGALLFIDYYVKIEIYIQLYIQKIVKIVIYSNINTGFMCSRYADYGDWARKTHLVWEGRPGVLDHDNRTGALGF